MLLLDKNKKYLPNELLLNIKKMIFTAIKYINIMQWFDSRTLDRINQIKSEEIEQDNRPKEKFLTFLIEQIKLEFN